MENEATGSGLRIRVDHVALKGIVTAIPESEIKNDAFHSRFGETAVDDIVKMIGVQTRRHSNELQTTADFCQASAQKLIAELGWAPESIDAIVFVSQTPDYRLPATACALQSRLKLRTSCAALDVNLGCSGYVYGLWLASKLIDGIAVRRVLLLAGDTSSKLINPNDRATAMLFGDAGSATALEFDQEAHTSYFLPIGRVLLLAGDTSSKLINPNDRATAMLFGDAGSATALEFDQEAHTSYFLLGTD